MTSRHASDIALLCSCACGDLVVGFLGHGALDQNQTKDAQGEMWKLQLKTVSVSLMWESNALKAMAFRNPERATQLLYEALRSDYAELSSPNISAQLDANDKKFLDEAAKAKRDYELEAHTQDQ